MARVMFDVDGVLRDFDTTWRALWWETFGVLPRSSTHWEYMFDCGKEQGLTKEETYDLVFHRWGARIMTTASPYCGSLEWFSKIQKQGHTIIIATHQPTKPMKSATMHWLTFNGIIPDEIYFVEDKYEVEADFYIDDRPRTLKWLPWYHPKAVVVGMDRPWNNVYEMENIYPVNSVREYWEIINETTRKAKSKRRLRYLSRT